MVWDGWPVTPGCCLVRRSTAALDAAAKVAVTLLPFYKQLFNMPYPLEKLDLVSFTCFATLTTSHGHVLS